MKLTFREIDRSNYNDCVHLTIADEQGGFVAPNMYSLVQVAYEPGLFPLGIYKDSTMVGFILYDFDMDIPGWSMSRFMIGKDYQNQGIGKPALRKFITYLSDKYAAKKIYTSVALTNEVAMKFYESAGFEMGEVFEYESHSKKYTERRMTLQL